MKTLIFTLLVGASTLAFAQYKTGNGGEGIQVSGGLFLRDLYERNLHETPFVGARAFPEFQSRISTLPLTAAQWEILAKKLTDAQALSGCLGELLTSALLSYQWTFEDLPLDLLPEEGVIRSLPDSMRVQIAIRTGTTIHIYRHAWDRLNDVHKIALLLHEAVYGLSGLDPYSGNQDNFFTAESVAALFVRQPNLGAADMIIRHVFGITDPLFCSKYSAFESSLYSPVTDKVTRLAHRPRLLQTVREVERFVDETCQHWPQASRGESLIVSYLGSESMRLKFEPYKSANRGVQYRLVLLPYNQRVFKSCAVLSGIRNEMACRSTLKAQLSKALSAEKIEIASPWQIDHSPFCTE